MIVSEYFKYIYYQQQSLNKNYLRICILLTLDKEQYFHVLLIFYGLSYEGNRKLV